MLTPETFAGMGKLRRRHPRCTEGRSVQVSFVEVLAMCLLVVSNIGDRSIFSMATPAYRGVHIHSFTRQQYLRAVTPALPLPPWLVLGSIFV